MSLSDRLIINENSENAMTENKISTEDNRKIEKCFPAERRDCLQEPLWVRSLLTATAVLFITLFLFVPLIYIFVQAFSEGVRVYLAALTDRHALAAIRLTLFAAAVAVPLNMIFGIAAAWSIAKFDFRGKGILVTLIDLPFAVSPVIAGLLFVILFGIRSPLGQWLDAHQIQILFDIPSIVIATLFVTFPFVARELIPVMQSQGTEEEQAARVLGARGWSIFWRVTLPNIRWGLLYGVILCNARAMGEFGAVAVVSGKIRGKTNTLPLHIENLYDEYHFTAAFATASVLAVLAVLTLILKTLIEKHTAA
jgi:sulfate transport system permease protein